MASWDIRGNDVYTIIRVLKSLGFLNASNEPTDVYIAFMDAASGPAVLAERIRETYAPLFHASREPHKESSDKLRNLFNIHSGGAEGTIAFQIQTFKALCDYADFSTPGAGLDHAGNGTAPRRAAVSTQHSPVSTALLGSAPMIHIDLHIHLPENKTSRDYQYIIQDIARFIYRHPDTDSDREAERS